MKAIIEAVAWTLLNALGIWLVAANLFQVGRLGAAAVGLLIILSAWTWLIWVLGGVVKKRLHAGRSKRIRSDA